jgi:hypothetical protein
MDRHICYLPILLIFKAIDKGFAFYGLYAGRINIGQNRATCSLNVTVCPTKIEFSNQQASF